MIIGNNTRQCLRRQRINFNAEPTKCPKYVTRLQSKLQQHGDIIISNTASQENINKLLNNMRSYMPGIRYFKNKNNVFNGININCNNNGFKISGKNIDLFTFLSNTLNCVESHTSIICCVQKALMVLLLLTQDLEPFYIFLTTYL